MTKTVPAAAGGEDKIRQRNMAKIIRAATAIFARKGFEGARMAEIAEAAGLPKANVYYYFASKEQVYVAIIQHLIDGWDAALRFITPESDPREALEAYVREKLDYSRKNGAESRLFANEIIAGASFLSRKDRIHMRLITRRRVEVMESWIAQGKMRRVDPRHLFVILWASTQYYSDFEITAADALEKRSLTRADYEDAARTIVDTVIRSLVPSRD